MGTLNLFVLPGLEERVPFVVHIVQDLLERADHESSKYCASSASDTGHLQFAEYELKAEAEGKAGLEGLGDKDTKMMYIMSPFTRAGHPTRYYWSADGEFGV